MRAALAIAIAVVIANGCGGRAPVEKPELPPAPPEEPLPADPSLRTHGPLSPFDRLRLATFRTGEAQLAEVLAGGTSNEPLATILDRVAARGYLWGHSDGN